MARSAVDDSIVYLANEIEEYLRQHPHAADTIEGIAKWWLTRQQYERTYASVSIALDYLIAQGKITKSMHSSKSVYKHN